jgi:single-stranded-DNA-specific exonuclease
VASGADAEAFLNPAPEQLHDPALLAGLPAAVERLSDAAEGGERVAVVGDYDVDGVTATALLMAVFGACGVAAVPVLPHRLAEGYGFQPLHVERAAAAGCRVIVTVDCGISSLAAVAAARERGIDVVVTDHHLPGEHLPAGAIVVNPRQAGCCYPFGDLAGAGLALKLAMAFGRRRGRELKLGQLLRIACLGTIADVVPLLGENRTIASLGLAALAHTRSVGLKALMDQAGLKPPVSAADVGFRIGPRLNAAGRLATPESALELLLSRDAGRAAELARELETCNRERQEEERRVVEEARSLLTSRAPLPAIGVAWAAGWHRGVVGIAAGRLARELCRPVVLVAADGEEATGSGRSVPGIDLHAFLRRWQGELERFGGHRQAVGLTVRRERLEELRRSWEEAAAAAWPPELLSRRYEYELSLAPGEVGGELLAEIGRLEPCGQGNPRPLLRVSGLRLNAPPRLFGRGHLSGRAAGDDGAQVDLVGWGWGERGAELAGRFDVLSYLEFDAYRGRPVLRLVDGRPA